MQAGDARATFERRRAQAECIEHAEPGWLQQETGADRTQLGALLEHGEFVPGAREKDRGGLAGGAVTDDRNAHGGGL